MKVLLLNGSPRANGNTALALAEMAKIKEPSLAKLGSIEGIGEARLKSYGEAFLSILVESAS